MNMPSLSVLFGGLLLGLVIGLSSLDYLGGKSKNSFIAIIFFLFLLGFATFFAIIIMQFDNVYPLSDMDRMGFIGSLFLTAIFAKLATK